MITDRQIRDLRERAEAARDHSTQDFCNRALCRDDDTCDQDGNPIAYADWTQEEARSECARLLDDGGAS